MWVEPDLNMPDGESLVRQLLVGKRWYKQAYGVDVRIGWNPDSFGYNWQLPQIYKKSGVDYFVTQKMEWNDTNQLPFKLFWWQSPDGSKVLAYFPARLRRCGPCARCGFARRSRGRAATVDRHDRHDGPLRRGRSRRRAHARHARRGISLGYAGCGFASVPCVNARPQKYRSLVSGADPKSAGGLVSGADPKSTGSLVSGADPKSTGSLVSGADPKSTGSLVSGHDFSRAEDASSSSGASAPASTGDCFVTPHFEFGTAQSWFTDVEKQIAPDSPVWNYQSIAKGYTAPPVVPGKVTIPTWDSELYFEYHRGVMTTQANHKHNMRTAEEEMLNAEKWSSLAWLDGLKYPADELTEDWKKVLFNQFHDLAAGSGIAVIYKDAQKDYDWVRMSTDGISTRRAAERLRQHVNTSSDGIPVLLFNPLGWKRSGDGSGQRAGAEAKQTGTLGR